MTHPTPNKATEPMLADAAIAFLKEASRYFSKIGHSGEDAGFWATQQNSINCLKIAALIEELTPNKATRQETDMGEDSDLLPCPHCGSRAKSYHRDDESGWSNTDWICCDAGDDGISPDCGAQTCLHETRAQAVAAWNRRTAHKPSSPGDEAA